MYVKVNPRNKLVWGVPAAAGGVLSWYDEEKIYWGLAMNVWSNDEFFFHHHQRYDKSTFFITAWWFEINNLEWLDRSFFAILGKSFGYYFIDCK